MPQWVLAPLRRFHGLFRAVHDAAGLALWASPASVTASASEGRAPPRPINIAGISAASIRADRTPAGSQASRLKRSHRARVEQRGDTRPIQRWARCGGILQRGAQMDPAQHLFFWSEPEQTGQRLAPREWHVLPHSTDPQSVSCQNKSKARARRCGDLLPSLNFSGLGRGDEHDEGGRALCLCAHRVERLRCELRLMLPCCISQRLTKHIATFLCDDDEAKWTQLSVIGNGTRREKDLFELFVGWSG